MTTDEELLRRFAEGQRSALGALADRYERRLLDLCLAILGSRDLATDAVQETWLRVVRYAKSFNGRSSAKTWLYRVAINQCRTFLATRPSDVVSASEESADPAGGPAEAAADQERNDHLRAAVEALSPPLRETILLCYVHGLTHAEAAQAMDVPVGTMKSRLHAALEELRTKVRA